MTIGIIGSGAIGTAFARTLARAGIEATISNSRGPDSLKELVGELGPTIKAGTREEAARADIVFRRGQLGKTAGGAGGTAQIGTAASSSTPTIRSRRRCSSRSISIGRVSSEVVADLVPGARVVKAFNHLRAEVLAGDPTGGRRTARAVLFRQRQRGQGRGGGAHRQDRLRRHRSWIARGRRQARPISRRPAAEPEPRQGRLMRRVGNSEQLFR